MKTKNKERRVLNIDKEAFDIIKEYCKKRSLKMNDWITKSILINISLDYHSSNKSREIEQLKKSII